VASYSQFVPFCQESIVTKYSAPAHDGHEYPEEAKLVIGFNDSIREAFTSRVYCVPGRIVEAVSGNMKTTLAGDEIAHHSPRPAAADDPSRNDTVMAHLLTRWTLRPYPYKPPPVTAAYPETAHRNVHETSDVPGQHKTEVSLAIEFQFSNPLYAALSSAAAPKIADKMIRAFEQRVKEVMEGPGHARDKTYTRKY
jgi:coenzyme Q-binding protein COQ10